jgi:hypothetical protein
VGYVGELVQVHASAVEVPSHGQELAVQGAPGEEAGTALGHRRLNEQPLYRHACGRGFGDYPGLFFRRQQHLHDTLAPTVAPARPPVG